MRPKSSGRLLHRCIEEEGSSFAAGRKLVDILHGCGTFALTALVHDGTETALITLNDSRAFEPFCFGMVGDAFLASSESCSHRRLGGFPEREYAGAEMTICSSRGVETRRVRTETEMPDVFQAVYFGNAGSLYRGEEIFRLRMGLGHVLAKRYGDTDADVVIPNPESGRGVSHGIAEGLGKPLLPGLAKQSQAIRTFQEAGRSKRMREVAVKFAAMDSVLAGRRIIMGDDSIVKGSVSEGGAVWSVYNAGAATLEFWVSYGPMFFPSFKEWRRGRECLDELAVQRAFRGDNPYDKTPEEINARGGGAAGGGSGLLQHARERAGGHRSRLLPGARRLLSRLGALLARMAQRGSGALQPLSLKPKEVDWQRSTAAHSGSAYRPGAIHHELITMRDSALRFRVAYNSMDSSERTGDVRTEPPRVGSGAGERLQAESLRIEHPGNPPPCGGIRTGERRSRR